MSSGASTGTCFAVDVQFERHVALLIVAEAAAHDGANSAVAGIARWRPWLP
jgi:hypothetical protein